MWSGGKGTLTEDGKIPANTDCFNCSSAPFMYFTLTSTYPPAVPGAPFCPTPSRLPFSMILYYSGQFLRALGGSKR